MNEYIYSFLKSIKQFFNRPFGQNCLIIGIIFMLLGIIIWKLFNDTTLAALVGFIGLLLLIIGVGLLMAPYNNRYNKKTVMVYKHEY